jgi:O-acetyl-ADP-ribose deacetylase (regulator of RNase III)
MGDQPASERSIHASTAASVRLAAQHGARRIAFPILGSGFGGFDLRRAAAVMLEAIRTTPEAEALDEIVLYGFSAADAELLRELIE